MVMNIEQKGFFQWEIALSTHKHPDLDVAYLTMNDTTLCIDDGDRYWNPIREADVVFVRCVGNNPNWEWYKMPFHCRKFMRPDAKLICQFDMDLIWLFHPTHTYTGEPLVPWGWAGYKQPKEFLKESKILEVADAYNMDYNPELEKLMSKPVYHVLLPQLVRYSEYTTSLPSLADRDAKSNRIAVFRHAVMSASYGDTLKKVVKVVGLSTRTFESRKGQWFPRRMFMDYLKNCFVAIDDNEGYYGWSRFGMECALAHTPCVGSTPSVKEFFPELHTEKKDYKKQIELIRKLYFDKDFWLKMAMAGKKNVLNRMDTDKLINELTEMVREVWKS